MSNRKDYLNHSDYSDTTDFSNSNYSFGIDFTNKTEAEIQNLFKEILEENRYRMVRFFLEKNKC